PCVVRFTRPTTSLYSLLLSISPARHAAHLVLHSFPTRRSSDLGYAFQAVARQAEDVEWLRHLSPYSWVYHQPPLRDGADVGGLLLTWGIAVALATASAFALARRDLRG